MIKKPLIKITQGGQRYRLVYYDNNKQVIFKCSNVTGDEAEFSEKVEFNDEKKAMKYWNKIK